MKKIFLIFCFQLFLNANAIPINTDFFKCFNDSYFEEYIFEALENNHDLKQTNYKIEQFRYEISKQFAKQLPELSVGSNYLGASVPSGDTNVLIKKNSYILPFKAIFEPDFFLKNRDKTKSKKKLYKASLANQKRTYISLLTDISNTYINILLFDYLINKQKEIVKDKEENKDFNKNKFNFGVISFIDLNDIFSELESQKIILENLIKQQKTNLYNFALLIGRSAYNCENIKRGNLKDFEYQKTIPNKIEQSLIYSRPDLIEIENQLKSAKIDISVARKEFLPSFNIFGFFAFDTAGGGNFFNWNSSFAYLLAGLSQDIFKGGAKIANLKIQKAKYNELFEKYLQADLNAIKEVVNALNLIKQDTIAQEYSKKQVDFEKQNFIASKRKLNSGTISKIDYLKNKNSLNQKEQLFANTKARRLNDYFALYKALGGQL
ncbi:MAG: TolC family protein [Candidatus Gastranaerophilales bacterium]|nr:TolC family protein [Candidatus Gastranaerophilales bacterium]